MVWRNPVDDKPDLAGMLRFTIEHTHENGDKWRDVESGYYDPVKENFIADLPYDDMIFTKEDHYTVYFDTNGQSFAIKSARLVAWTYRNADLPVAMPDPYEEEFDEAYATM